MRIPLLLAALLAAPTLAGCLDGAGERLSRGITDDAAPRPDTFAPGWPAEADATIRPGVTIHTEARDCPSSFLLARRDNGTLFLATTAYCVRDLAVGALATVGDEKHLAVLAYSSWQTMAEHGEADPQALEYNDLALFYLDTTSRPHAHPALQGIGGPTGVANASALALGDRVLARADLPAPPPAAPGARDDEQESWRDFTVTGRAGDWAILVHGTPPTLPGDMGGAVLTPDGEAVGILVNLGLNPHPGANGVARLDTMMAYAREHANLDLVLATAPLLGRL